ncbi:fertilization-influencing membrane protein isoform X3 [Tamandua tetradactyla]|uniref:fertilization-influencing membrane protein isoform X3 n=1 Tax=Tamandua tetradactyla TaxID=48850 RepID=UPI0040540D56
MTSQSPPAGGLMTLWQGVLVWLAGLGAIETAPGPPPGSAQTTGSGAEAWLFLDTPDFFDYADSDEARLLAVSEFIGEEPVTFVNSDSGAGFFHHVLVAVLGATLFFLLCQFCTHMTCQRGA